MSCTRDLNSSSEPISISTNPYQQAILETLKDMERCKEENTSFYKLVKQDSQDPKLSTPPADLAEFVAGLGEKNKKTISRRVMDSLGPFFSSLLQFTTSIDVLIQADPTGAASIVWGGARLVFILAADYIKYFEDIAILMEDIVHELPNFEIYALQAKDEVMVKLLCASFKEILSFWRSSSRILEQKGKRMLLLGIFKPLKENSNNSKLALKRNSKLVKDRARALDHQSIGQIKGTTKEILAKGVKVNSLRDEEMKPRIKMSKIRQWILGGIPSSSTNPEDDMISFQNSRHPHTAEWIFHSQQYLGWETSRESAALLIHAPPGTGKTILMSSIIHRVANGIPEYRNVIYFFCRWDNLFKRTAIAALRSIALQALEIVGYVPDEIWRIYEDHCAPGIDDPALDNLAVIERIITNLLRGVGYVSIIIDGLDECPDSELVDVLIRLSQKPVLGVIKWLFSSQADFHIVSKFEQKKFQQLSITSSMTQDDVRKYLKDSCNMWCGTSDQFNKMVESCEGNFVQVRSMVERDENGEFSTPRDIDLLLERYEPGVGRCWFRSLQRLKMKVPAVQNLVKTLFAVLITAIKPMTVDEVIDILAVELGEDHSSGRMRTKETLLKLCTPFVVSNAQDGISDPTIRLQHKSLRDFIVQDPRSIDFVTEDYYDFFINTRLAHAEIGKRCITYLSYSRYNGESPLSDALINANEHAALVYAAVFWFKHLEAAGSSLELFNIAKEFLQSPNFWSCVQIQREYAPHLFSTLSTSDNFQFKMEAPADSQHNSSTSNFSYASALPTWLNEFEKEGENVDWGCSMFVREWSDILVQNAIPLEPYFFTILGKKCPWQRTKIPSKRVRVLALEDDQLHTRAQLRELRRGIEIPFARQEAHFEMTKSGLQCYLISVHKDENVSTISWEEWNVPTSHKKGKRPFNLKQSSHIGDKTQLFIKSSTLDDQQTALSPLNSFLFDKEEEPLLSPEVVTTMITKIENHVSVSSATLDKSDESDECKIVLSRLGVDLAQRWLWDSAIQDQKADACLTIKFHSSLSYIQKALEAADYHGSWAPHLQKSVHHGDVVARVYCFKNELVANAEDPDFDADSDYDSDSDSGDSESDAESTSKKHNSWLWFMSVTKGQAPAHWYHHFHNLATEQTSLPVFHPTASMLLWIQEDGEAIVLDLENWTTKNLTIPKSDPAYILISTKLHFSDQLLHKATISYCGTEKALEIKQSFFLLNLESEVPSISIVETDPLVCYKALTCYYRLSNLPISFAWYQDILYAAIGRSQIKLLRFPPFKPLSTASTSITENLIATRTQVDVLDRHLFIPGSSYDRSLRFFVEPPSSSSSQTSSSSSTKKGDHKAIFAMSGVPGNDLPPLVMKFQLDEWKEYRYEEKGQEGAMDVVQYLKGKYIPDKLVFSMPIRSGLDWRRSTLVTCW